MSKSLKEINNQMKIDVNEASGISDKIKLKFLKLVERHFEVSLPHENFLNIDIELLENGNVKMRDDEYKTTSPVKTLEELNEKFNAFQEEVNHLLNKNETNFSTMKKTNERNNLIVLCFITIIIVLVGIYSIQQLIFGNIYGVIWIVIMVGCNVIPATGNSIRNRYARAWRYLKSIIYKNKKK